MSLTVLWRHTKPPLAKEQIKIYPKSTLLIKRKNIKEIHLSLKNREKTQSIAEPTEFYVLRKLLDHRPGKNNAYSSKQHTWKFSCLGK